MSRKETPLATVKRLYGSKEKLIEAAVKALEGLGEKDAELDERLAGKPNSKLLRLIDTANAIKERYGNKEKMIAALLAASGKAKDSDFAARLEVYTLPRLYDLTRTAEHRAAKKAKKAA
jgi:hypothetical protein